MYILNNRSILANYNPDSLNSTLDQLQAVPHTYKKRETIFPSGMIHEELGLLMAGKVEVSMFSEDGIKSIACILEPGDIIGDYNALEGKSSDFSYSALEDCTLFKFSISELGNGLCRNLEKFRLLAALNLASQVSALKTKSLMLSASTLRERILIFLRSEQTKAGTNPFYIEFDRLSMACYLGCDRSALSKELSKMQRERILLYRKNKFQLLI